MTQLIHYFVVLSLGVLLGATLILTTLPSQTAVVCESGSETEVRWKLGGRPVPHNADSYELWSAVCTFDTVNGKPVTVTMID